MDAQHQRVWYRMHRLGVLLFAILWGVGATHQVHTSVDAASVDWPFHWEVVVWKDAWHRCTLQLATAPLLYSTLLCTAPTVGVVP